MTPNPIYAAIAVAASLVFTSSAAEARSSPTGDARQVKRLSIAYINDIHAQLEPHPELYWNEKEERVQGAGGLSRIATALKQLEADRPHGMLRIDGGDTFQGSGPGAWTNGEVMVRPMNALNLDVSIPGNWSVAYGAQQLRKLRDAVNYPMIAANMVDQETGRPMFKPYLVKEVGGIKVGLLGFTDPDIPTRQPPHMSEGLNFQAAEVLQPLIDELRNEHQVDLVVLITHIGLHKAVPLTAKLQGVDISLSSDTHERTYEPIVVGETWVVEAGAFGSLLGILDLTFENGKLTDRRWELIELRRESFPEDEEVKAIVDEVLAPHRERMNRQIGYTDVWLERYNVMSTSMDQLIADALRDAAATDVALSNGFRFSPPTAPGPITEGDLWNWLPMNLDLKVGEADGRQLMEYWENEFENVFSKDFERLFGGWLARASTNMQVRFDSTAPAGERLRSITIDGEPLDPDKTYTLVAGARKGSPEDQIHRVKRCRAVQQLPATTHDAVRSYLARQQGNSVPQLGPPPVLCIVRPDVVRSQYLEVIKKRNELREAEEAFHGHEIVTGDSK